MIFLFVFFLLLIIFPFLRKSSKKIKSANNSMYDGGTNKAFPKIKISNSGKINTVKNCPFCQGAGFTYQMETTMVSKTEYYFDPQGHSVSRNVFRPETKSVRKICPYCGGSGKKIG
jgi:hypothetical protein